MFQEEQSFTTKHDAKIILVIADDTDNRWMYTEILAFYHVWVVRNGPEAGFHATSFACASRCRMLVPYTRNRRARLLFAWDHSPLKIRRSRSYPRSCEGASIHHRCIAHKT